MIAPVLELVQDPQVWIAFATLTALELVLGIDNIIFISTWSTGSRARSASARAASASRPRC